MATWWREENPLGGVFGEPVGGYPCDGVWQISVQLSKKRAAQKN